MSKPVFIIIQFGNLYLIFGNNNVSSLPYCDLPILDISDITNIASSSVVL